MANLEASAIGNTDVASYWLRDYTSSLQIRHSSVLKA